MSDFVLGQFQLRRGVWVKVISTKADLTEKDFDKLEAYLRLTREASNQNFAPPSALPSEPPASGN